MVRIGTRYQVPLGPKKRLTGLSKQVAQAAPRAMRNTYIPLAKSLDPPTPSQAVARAAETHLEHFSSRDVANFLWACARCSALFRPLLSQGRLKG